MHGIVSLDLVGVFASMGLGAALVFRSTERSNGTLRSATPADAAPASVPLVASRLEDFAAVVLELDASVARRSRVRAGAVVRAERAAQRDPVEAAPALLRIPIVVIARSVRVAVPAGAPTFVDGVKTSLVLLGQVGGHLSGSVAGLPQDP
jgi:hypothetical protein